MNELVDVDFLAYRDEIRWFPYPELTILNRSIPGHGWSFEPNRNIFFCNIPKCASTSIKNYIIATDNLDYKDPFYFTVIRDPKERLKSALWMMNAGQVTFTLNEFVDDMKNNEVNDSVFMHTAPQTEFINNSPLAGHFDLKIYRIDQIDEIFNVKMPQENASSHSDSYKQFTQMFNEQYDLYASYLEDYYADDIMLWNSLNK